MTIRWSKASVRQLTAAHSFIAADSPDAADRLVSRIEAEVEQLLLYPNSGREGRVKDTRELSIVDTPYIVAYRVKGKSMIQILAVLHGKRRWPEQF